MNTKQAVIEEDPFRVADLESCEREAYERTPDDPAEFAIWDKVAAWPAVGKG
jgi:hypothetical protein